MQRQVLLQGQHVVAVHHLIAKDTVRQLNSEVVIFQVIHWFVVKFFVCPILADLEQSQYFLQRYNVEINHDAVTHNLFLVLTVSGDCSLMFFPFTNISPTYGSARRLIIRKSGGFTAATSSQ